jgi:hypothetical protein
MGVGRKSIRALAKPSKDRQYLRDYQSDGRNFIAMKSVEGPTAALRPLAKSRSKPCTR